MLPAGQTSRPRDPIWDALESVFGFPADRSLRNRTVKDLRQAQATAEDIFARVQAWPLHFPGLTLTERALVKFWGQLARQPLRADPKDVESFRERMLLTQWAESER